MESDQLYKAVRKEKFFQCNVQQMSSVILVFISVVHLTNALEWYDPTVVNGETTYGSYRFHIQQHLSAISPYFTSNDDGLNPNLPQGCTVKKAVYFVRHGSIYANDYDYNETIILFLNRMKNFSHHVDFNYFKEFNFLSNWTSPVVNPDEQVEQLTRSGALEAFNLGTKLAYRYPHLLKKSQNQSFKIWTSESSRTWQSALMILQGLNGGRYSRDQLVNVSEEETRGANTLTPKETCSRFKGSWGSKQAETWLKHYSRSIIERFHRILPLIPWSPDDILAMQELCAYELVIRGSSPFCSLFSVEDWLSFEYYFDVKYYYEFGYGNDLSPTLGMPWLIASSQLLQSRSSSRKTKDQNVYITVAHREMPPLILSALGLYNDSIDPNKTLPLDEINYDRVWKSSEIVPFLGQIALERFDCQSKMTINGSFVRILVNESPKALPGCNSGPGASCPFDQYMNYVKQRDDFFDDFSKACHIDYPHSSDTLNIFNEHQ